MKFTTKIIAATLAAFGIFSTSEIYAKSSAETENADFSSLEKDSVEYTAQYKAIEKELNRELKEWERAVDAKCKAEMYERWHRDPDLLRRQGYTGFTSGKKPYYNGVPCSQKLGFVHERWNKKKEILKEKYNIDWHSPAERNHSIMFD